MCRRGDGFTPRSNFDELANSLTALGADHVLTYDSLNDKSIKDNVKSWTDGKVLIEINFHLANTDTLNQSIRLVLNCVSGKETASMMRLVGCVQ